MQKGLIRHDFFLFKGVSAWEEGNRIPPNTLFYAENSRFEGGRWGSRKGYTAFGDELSGGTNIKGLMDYQRFPSGVRTDYLVAYYDSKFYRYNLSDASNTEIVPAAWAATDIDVEGVSYNGSLYVCDGVNRIGKINDTSFTEIATAPRARLIESWGEKMWAVDNTAPASVQYTATATASSPSNIEDWTTVGASGAELIGKGGRIESLRKLSEKLYVFKANEIEVFTGFDLSGANPVPLRESLSKTTGAVNHRATVIVENDIWFLSPTLEIRSLGREAGYFDDTRTEDMSAIIKRHKRDLDLDQSGAVAWYNDGLFKVALKENGSSQNNLVFVYDRDNGFWNFDRATSPKVATTAMGGAYFGVDGNSGYVYKDENGYSDNGFPMSWGGKTGLVDDGRADLSKQARYLYVRGARSQGTVITLHLLGEDFTRLETLTIPAPTSAEIAAASDVVEDEWGQVGDIVGGGGYTGAEPGAPLVVRFNYVFSLSSTNRMFGVESESSLNGQRAFIDEIKLKYIPRGEFYNIINA